MSELNDFAGFITQEVNDTLHLSGGSDFRESAFTQLIMDYLADGDETRNVQVCTAIHRTKTGNRLRQINGYGIWDNFETLDVFISDFKGDGQLYTLPPKRATADLKLAVRYVEYLLRGDFDGTEDSAAEREFQQNFYTFKSGIMRIRVMLLTDGLIRKDIQVERNGWGEQTVITEIWDLERIYQLWSSQQKRDPIEIDVSGKFGQRIRCLSVAQTTNNYISYLAIVPGQFLADLYDLYGTRLLEQNVRVYLQSMGKVNKEIRKTILKKPGMFMAYNNGISATVKEIHFEKELTSGYDFIRMMKDLQIVNGGQTISSVFYAYKKDGASLNEVNIQMKISLIQDEGKMEEMVKNISRYSNSQNKVDEADFTSNQSFHILLEELSRTTWAPPRSGNQQTRWYYERVKGQYKEEVNKQDKKGKIKNFKIRNPPEQVIRKDELAKFHHVWHELPYWVARSSQKNYLHFISQNQQLLPARDYFKGIIAVALLFKEAEQIYGRKPNSIGDLRYIVVPYSISWLTHQTNGKLDLDKIWKLQVIPRGVSTILRSILLKVNDFFQTSKPGDSALISEWAKKEECWNMLKSMDLEVDLKPIQQWMTGEDKDKKNLFGIAPRDPEISTVTIAKWETILQFGTETGKLDTIQLGAVRNIISRLKSQKTLTEQLIQHGLVAAAIYDNEKQRKKII